MINPYDTETERHREKIKHFHYVLQLAESLPELKSMTRRDFINWLKENPKIYFAFRHFAMEAIKQKRSRFSCYMIRERVRWYTNIEWGGEFKISNNVTPYMNRLLPMDIPILDKIFSKKEVDYTDFRPYQNDDMFSRHPL